MNQLGFCSITTGLALDLLYRIEGWMIILKISSSLLSLTSVWHKNFSDIWTFMFIFLFVHESEYSWFDFPFPAIPPVIMNALEKKAFMKVNEIYIVKIFFSIFCPVLFTTSCAFCHRVFAAIPSVKCSSSSGACGSVVSKGKMIMSLIQLCPLKHPPPSFLFYP